MSKVFSSVLPIAATVIGAYLGGPWGAAAGGALGGMGSAAMSGGNILQGGAMGGLLGYAGGGGLASLGGGAAGLGGAALEGTDPIETIYQSMQATGAPTASAAANQLGYSSVQDMVNAANPYIAGAGTQIAGAGGPGTGPTGISPTVGTAMGRLGSALPQSVQGIQLPAGFAGAAGAGTGGAGLGPIGQALGIGSGAMGIVNSLEMQKLAREAGQQRPYSATAEAQLNALLQNPSSIQGLPGYQAGLDAVQRSMAAQGYTGSGNMMAALQQYGGNAYNQQVQTLSALAGQGAPQYGAAMQGLAAGNQMLGGGLASLGYTAARGGF